MNLKKLMALLMALVLAAVCLAGCAGKTDDNKDDNPSASDDQNSDNPSDNQDNTDNSADDEQTPDPGLYIDGEKVNDEGVVIMTVNGIDIPFDEYRYLYNYYDYSYFSGGDHSVYEDNPDAYSYLLETVESAVLENNWGNILAASNGVKLTDEDLAEIETHMQEQRDEFESDEEFHDTLAQSSLSEDLLRRIISQQILCNRIYTELYESLDDATVKEWLNENYVRVHHVLVAFDEIAKEEAFAEATDEELKEEAKKRADALIERINYGEKVYDLAQELAHDPGMVDNTEGYFFTTGEMVEPFEKSAFALKVGEISEPVETSYGYHIIERLEQEDYMNEHWDEIRETGTVGILYRDVDKALDEAEITYGEYYDKLDYNSIY